MLAFVTSVRHPQNSSSYRRVGRLLDRTLQSLCRQSDDDFRVIVVHNERPHISFDDPHISFVRVGFPAPSNDHRPDIDYGAHILDKGTKYAIGVRAAQDHGADHVMFVDADDLLHHDLAALANAEIGRPGWFSNQGYIYTDRTRRVQFVDDGFHHKNGSTSIVRTDLIRVPRTIPLNASIDEILAAVHPDDFRVIAEHGKWEERLGTFGEVMVPMPFPASVWVIGTGENHSRNLVSARNGQPITRDITESFGLQPPSRARSAVAHGSLFGRRVARNVARR